MAPLPGQSGNIGVEQERESKQPRDGSSSQEEPLGRRCHVRDWFREPGEKRLSFSSSGFVRFGSGASWPPVAVTASVAVAEHVTRLVWSGRPTESRAVTLRLRAPYASPSG